MYLTSKVRCHICTLFDYIVAGTRAFTRMSPPGADTLPQAKPISGTSNPIWREILPLLQKQNGFTTTHARHPDNRRIALAFGRKQKRGSYRANLPMCQGLAPIGRRPWRSVATRLLRPSNTPLHSATGWFEPGGAAGRSPSLFLWHGGEQVDMLLVGRRTAQLWKQCQATYPPVGQLLGTGTRIPCASQVCLLWCLFTWNSTEPRQPPGGSRGLSLLHKWIGFVSCLGRL